MSGLGCTMVFRYSGSRVETPGGVEAQVWVGVLVRTDLLAAAWGQKAVAHLLSDLDIAEIGRYVKELHDIEAALARIRMAGYGACIDCGEEIDHARLTAYPTAKRCLECQRCHEQAKIAPGHPTL